MTTPPPGSREAAQALLVIEAALAPPADVAGEVEEIRKRLNDRKPSGPRGHVPPITQSERDMATLLAMVGKMRAALDDIATDKREHGDDEVAIIYRMQDRAKAALGGD